MAVSCRQDLLRTIVARRRINSVLMRCPRAVRAEAARKRAASNAARTATVAWLLEPCGKFEFVRARLKKPCYAENQAGDEVT